MTEDMKNLLITLPFVIILFLLFFWLVKALAPGRKEVDRRDKFEQAGYETVRQTRTKEFAVIGLSTAVIGICLGIMGYLTWELFSAGADAGASDTARSLETILLFVPAIVLLVIVAVASKRYIHRQEAILHEFNEFKSKRMHALKEYQEKRSGKGPENEDGSPATIRQRVDRSKPGQQQKQSKRRRRK